jgi:transposase
MLAPTTPLITLSLAELATLRSLLHQADLAPRVRERLEMVKAAARGFDRPTIAQWTGRSETTVQDWLERYSAGGITALADAPRRGRPRKADAAYLAALEQAANTPPRDLGQPFDIWTSARLSAYLAETTGVRIVPGWLRVLLHRQGCSCSRPKHTLGHLQDPDEVAACQQALARAGGTRPYAAGAVRVP